MSGFMTRERLIFGGSYWQLAAMGAAIFISWQGLMAVPLQIGAVVDGLGMSEQRSGLLGTAEIFTLASVAIVLAGRIAIWSKVRVALVGLGIAVIGQLLSTQVENFPLLLALRISVGIGAGLLYGSACASIAGQRGGERLYAWGTSLSQVLTAGMLMALPLASAMADYKGVYAVLAVLALVFGLLLINLPDGQGEIERREMASVRKNPVWIIVLLLVGITLFNLAIGMVWAFTERRAEELGFGPGEIGVLLAMLPLGGIGGSMFAGLVGVRMGRTLPLVLGMSACMIACLIIAFGPSRTLLFTAIFSLGFFELFCFPFLIATAAAMDSSGRLATAAGGLSILAYALGPAIGGLISTGYSATAVCISSAVLCLSGVLVLVPVGHKLDIVRADIV